MEDTSAFDLAYLLGCGICIQSFSPVMSQKPAKYDFFERHWKIVVCNNKSIGKKALYILNKRDVRF